MANIYSYAPEAWEYNKVTRLSSNSFRFNGIGAYAKSVITGAGIGELGGELFFRGFISPSQYNLSQGLRCRLDIYSKQDETQQNWEVEKHFVYIKGDRNGAVNQKIATYGGTFDHIDLRIEVLGDGQLSIGGGTIELTSFIIGNASSTSVGNIEEEINAALPFLIYDVNKGEQTNYGSDEEVYVGMIPVNMQRDNTDTDAGFRTNITVDSDGTLTERFYRDGIEELLSPVVTDLKAGRHVITDDHAYLNVTKGPHTYLATLQFEGGNMEIDTRKTLYTVETSRAGHRDIAIEGNIIDMALSGVQTKLTPDEIWLMVQSLDSDEIIHIQHGTYNPETQSVGFQNDIEYLDEVVNGCIEFDGHWEKSATEVGKKKFISSGKPKVLLQREDGSLKYGDYDKPDIPQLIIESSGVVDCSLILGWNFISTTEQSNNMGMVAAYIKDNGNAYYRTITNGVMDVSPFPLTFAGAVLPLKEIRTFRTNDYRVGFTVADSVDNLFTILTDRYWQGDSVESVYLQSNFGDGDIGYLANSNHEPTVILYAINPDNNNEVQIHFNEKLMPTDEEITGLSLVDANGVVYAITGAKVSETIPATVSVDIAYNPNAPTIQDEMLLFPNGITGFTAPMRVSIENSNLKNDKEVYLLNSWTLNEPVPNGSILSTSLVDHQGSAINVPRYNFLNVAFDRNIVTYVPNFIEVVDSFAYDKNHLQVAFGRERVTYTPTLTEMLMSNAYGNENGVLVATLAVTSAVYSVQAYSTNNIPI